jgi:hypothetical protein
MQKTKNDLTNEVFGELTVRFFSKKSSKSHKFWFCDCSCGTKNIEIREDNLTSGTTKSCGHLLTAARRKFFSTRSKNMLTMNRKCTSCGLEFSVSYEENDSISEKFMERKKKCDPCSLKKTLGTRISKYDW